MHPILKVTAKLSPLFRGKRMQRFLDTFQPTPQTRILDVGGLPRFWQDVKIDSQITILNLEPLDDFEKSFLRPNHSSVVGDGTRLDFKDQSFDIVFSNSVIEHLGDASRQAAFAAECTRVGRAHWVQTPAKEFVMEPHYLALFVHWFPKHIQKKLLPRFSLWGWLSHPKEEMLNSVLAELRLLRRKEFKTLFPRSQIWTERCLGLPKSYTAYRLLERAPARTYPQHEELVAHARA